MASVYYSYSFIGLPVHNDDNCLTLIKFLKVEFAFTRNTPNAIEIRVSTGRLMS